MKLWHLIALILIILVVAAAILFKLWPSQQTTVTQPGNTVTTSQTATGLIGGCYKAYLNAYINQTKYNNPVQFKQITDACFTPEFVANWQNIVDHTDSDPVLLAQDYDQSWLTSQNVQILSDGIALLTLGSGPKSEKLIVQYQTVPDGWRISGVSIQN